MTGLEEQFDRDEFIVSMLKEIRDKVDLQQKGNASVLAAVADLNSKVDTISSSLPTKRYDIESDAAKKQRERTW